MGLPSLQLDNIKYVPSSCFWECSKCTTGRVCPGHVKGAAYDKRISIYIPVLQARLLSLAWSSCTLANAISNVESSSSAQSTSQPANFVSMHVIRYANEHEQGPLSPSVRVSRRMAANGHSGKVLHARLSDISMLASTLRAVHFSSFARITLSASGIEVVTEANHIVQGTDSQVFLHAAHAYLYASIFDRYSFHAPENWLSLEQQRNEELDPDESLTPCVAFEINLKVLVSCFAVFESRVSAPSSRPSARFSAEPMNYIDIVYEKVGEPLCLHMQNGRLETSFRLRTLDSPLTSELTFNPDQTTAQVIMKSAQLAPAFQELSSSGESQLQLAFTPASHALSASFQLTTEGHYGSTEIEFPYDQVITEKFVCLEPIRHGYPIECVGYMVPALRHSLKTSLRTDTHGMLSVQFMITGARTASRPHSVSESGNAFVDFLCCPLDSRL